MCKISVRIASFLSEIFTPFLRKDADWHQLDRTTDRTHLQVYLGDPNQCALCTYSNLCVRFMFCAAYWTENTKQHFQFLLRIFDDICHI
jgi:hypothetical protein